MDGKRNIFTEIGRDPGVRALCFLHDCISLLYEDRERLLSGLEILDMENALESLPLPSFSHPPDYCKRRKLSLYGVLGPGGMEGSCCSRDRNAWILLTSFDVSLEIHRKDIDHMYPSTVMARELDEEVSYLDSLLRERSVGPFETSVDDILTNLSLGVNRDIVRDLTFIVPAVRGLYSIKGVPLRRLLLKNRLYVAYLKTKQLKEKRFGC